MITQALRALRVVNGARTLLRGVDDARARGTPVHQHLLGAGFDDLTAVADVLSPGAGDVATSLMRELTDLRAGDPVIGEYRVIDEAMSSEPWAGAARALLRRTWGGHVILGQPGSGKTTLARSLAERWADATGYRIEALNMYDEDLPYGAVTIGMDTLRTRMKTLIAALAGMEARDDDDKRPPAPELDDLIRRIGRRIIVIDEASLGLGTGGATAERKVAMQALAQCRHLDWLIIYIGQWAGQLPGPLLGLCTLFCKAPTGDEESTDRQVRAVMSLWQQATEGHAEIRHSDWWRYWPDPRAWSYLRMPAGIDGSIGYRGMIPNGEPRGTRHDAA